MIHLRLCYADIEKETEAPEIDPFDFQFYNDDCGLMLNWIHTVENIGNPLLGETGDPPCHLVSLLR